MPDCELSSEQSCLKSVASLASHPRRQPTPGSVGCSHTTGPVPGLPHCRRSDAQALVAWLPAVGDAGTLTATLWNKDSPCMLEAKISYRWFLFLTVEPFSPRKEHKQGSFCQISPGLDWSTRQQLSGF